SDVIQETYLEASARLADYLQKPTMPFFLWLRFLAGQKLVTLHRHHLGRQMRDAGREVALYRGGLPETTSAALAAQLLGHEARPSEAAGRPHGVAPDGPRYRRLVGPCADEMPVGATGFEPNPHPSLPGGHFLGAVARFGPTTPKPSGTKLRTRHGPGWIPVPSIRLSPSTRERLPAKRPGNPQIRRLGKRV